MRTQKKYPNRSINEDFIRVKKHKLQIYSLGNTIERVATLASASCAARRSEAQMCFSWRFSFRSAALYVVSGKAAETDTRGFNEAGLQELSMKNVTFNRDC
ncbi:hypothetical protein ABEB36_008820 [Hypothenemus hampei]|uniref:Uncharacterized protein n=1 Tax=Hypothenemus hampei TaxID=57062 RepID=A0ABD1ER37_HYPHA